LEVNDTSATRVLQTVWISLLCVAAVAALLIMLFLRLRRPLVTDSADQARIRPDLHDALLQDLQGLMFRLQAVRQMLPERPADAMALLDAALDSGDQAVAKGHNRGLDHRESPLVPGELTETLVALSGEFFAASTSLIPDYKVLIEGQPRSIDPMVWDQIYRLTREAFRNALSYAQAARIEVELSFSPALFIIRVRDDGIGMDPEDLKSSPGEGSGGLVAMRANAARFGGDLSVWSQIGAGTEIELRIPEKIAYRRVRAAQRLPIDAPPS
jgi:signal transduction histidine kinase